MIYWTNSVGNTISVADLNGSQGHTLKVLGAILQAPRAW
jgi:hypothetical protein